MTKIILGLSILFSMLALSTAEAAYYFISPPGVYLHPEKRTHVLVVGRGNELGAILQDAAVAKMKKIMQVYPKDQIVMISTEEVSEAVDTARFQNWNLNFIRKAELLYPEKLMDELEPFKKIASFHVFSHGGVVPGVFLDREVVPTPTPPYKWNRDIPWMTKNPTSKRLIGHFTDDAFGALYGCNTGHIQAAVLARTWNIPMAGSLSSTHFENMFQDGQFYVDDSKLKSKMHPCAYGDCYRLRPDMQTYNGMWGVFKQGLPIYKFFCGNMKESKCLAGMAASVATNISNFNSGLQMDYAEYAASVREWLCPTGPWGSTIQRDCLETLKKIDFSTEDRTYMPFKGPTPQCTFNSCYANPNCENTEDYPMCAKDLPPSKTSTTFVDEYLTYLKAYVFFTKLRPVQTQ